MGQFGELSSTHFKLGLCVCLCLQQHRQCSPSLFSTNHPNGPAERNQVQFTDGAIRLPGQTAQREPSAGACNFLEDTATTTRPLKARVLMVEVESVKVPINPGQLESNKVEKGKPYFRENSLPYFSFFAFGRWSSSRPPSVQDHVSSAALKEPAARLRVPT